MKRKGKPGDIIFRRLKEIDFSSRDGEVAAAMSLSLLQGYSSEEENGPGAPEDDVSPGREIDNFFPLTSDGEEEGGRRRGRAGGKGNDKSIFDHPKHLSSNSLLPSAFDVFSEVAGPPDFLNNSVREEEKASRDGEEKWRGRGGSGKSTREKKNLPAGVVMEAKAQLTGARDRVRSDIEGSGLPNSGSATKASNEGPKVVSAANPEPNDVAKLLRMCVQCGIPKTYSHNKGMVCPLCNDRPPPDPNTTREKNKGSMIKDKEKNKRMKGQSSHATWKSETEMQLRQQFD